MKLLFEKQPTPAAACTILPACDVPSCEYRPCRMCRRARPRICLRWRENELSRHYTELAEQTYGVNDGFYPSGLLHHEIQPQSQRGSWPPCRALPAIHPLQPEDDRAGLPGGARIWRSNICAQITGMDAHDLPAGRGRARRVHRPDADQSLSSRHREIERGPTLSCRIPPTAPTRPAPAMAGFHGGQHSVQRRTAASTWRRCGQAVGRGHRRPDAHQPQHRGPV